MPVTMSMVDSLPINKIPYTTYTTSASPYTFLIHYFTVSTAIIGVHPITITGEITFDGYTYTTASFTMTVTILDNRCTLSLVFTLP